MRTDQWSKAVFQSGYNCKSRNNFVPKPEWASELLNCFSNLLLGYKTKNSDWLQRGVLSLIDYRIRRILDRMQIFCLKYNMYSVRGIDSSSTLIQLLNLWKIQVEKSLLKHKKLHIMFLSPKTYYGIFLLLSETFESYHENETFLYRRSRELKNIL